MASPAHPPSLVLVLLGVVLDGVGIGEEPDALIEGGRLSGGLFSQQNVHRLGRDETHETVPTVGIPAALRVAAVLHSVCRAEGGSVSESL